MTLLGNNIMVLLTLKYRQLETTNSIFCTICI